MNAIAHNEDLREKLKECLQDAKAYESESEGVNHTDVVCIGRAIEAVSLRLVYLKNKTEAEAEEKAKTAEKKESKEKNK